MGRGIKEEEDIRYFGHNARSRKDKLNCMRAQVSGSGTQPSSPSTRHRPQQRGVTKTSRAQQIWMTGIGRYKKRMYSVIQYRLYVIFQGWVPESAVRVVGSGPGS